MPTKPENVAPLVRLIRGGHKLWPHTAGTLVPRPTPSPSRAWPCSQACCARRGP